MSRELSEKTTKLLERSLVILAIIAMIMYFVGSLLSLVDLGCIFRYGSRSTTGETSDVIAQSVKISANANYSTVAILDSNGGTSFVTDPNGYGKWYNTGITVSENTDVKLGITGTVSLCSAYLPSYNPEQNTANGNLTPSNVTAPMIPSAPIPIPRIGDSTFLTIMLDAKDGTWWNVAELENADQVMVKILPERNTDSDVNVPYVSSITGKSISGDCTSGKNTYSPVCGRYSVYPVGSYQGVNRCYNLSYQCNQSCSSNDDKCYKCKIGLCGASGSGCTCHNTCYYWSTADGNGVQATINVGQNYDVSGSYTVPYSTDINILINNSIYPSCPDPNSTDPNHMYDCDNTNPNKNNNADANICNQYCKNNPNNNVENGSSCIPTDIKAGYNNHQNDFAYPLPSSPPTQYWFSANTATGLLYRFDSNLAPTSPSSIGSPASSLCIPGVGGYCFSAVSPGNQILNISSSSSNTQYLQYYLLNSGTPASNTGGYMIQIQQTKCSRSNGVPMSDKGYINRGGVQYMVLDSSLDPNADPTLLTGAQTFSFRNEGGGQYVTNLNSPVSGTLWVLISNKPTDYKDSVGDYELSVLTPVAHGQFSRDALTPVLVQLNNMVLNAGMKMFGNMTCYNDDPNDCKDFFSYVRAMLNLYIVIFGLMFLMGMVQISSKDLVIRIIKVAFVAGLLNGQTYLFFNQYIFVLMKNFTNEMIGNISGYNAHTEGGVVNPFMFLDGLMTKIFFSKIFVVQVLSLISFGFAGIFYFIAILTFIFMIVLTLFRAIAVYLMSFIGMAVLISLAPIFLTFILFSQTKSLFDNWVRVLVRFMLEPLVLLVGIIILTQLVEIFLDNVLSFSVCWRCNVIFALPFTTIGSIPLFFLDAPDFCIYWFSPWGVDYRDGLMGISMRDLFSLGIIAFCMYGYGTFSSSLVGRITNSAGGATAQAASSKMTGAFAKLTKLNKVAPVMQKLANLGVGSVMEGLHKGGSLAREGIKSRMTGEESGSSEKTKPGDGENKESKLSSSGTSSSSPPTKEASKE